MGSCVHMQESARPSWLTEGGSERVGRARLTSIPVAHSPFLVPLPQAEAAGNLEVVTLLQDLQTRADDLAPSPVSPPRQG